ncbi:MAG: hypothetical protein MJ162_04735 [Treponema sp.]|nr:hypothetical protein [Treponema sp.]
MKKIITSLLLLSGVTSFIFSQDISTPKFKGWKQAETEHFRFIYEDASKEAAENYALIADEAWNKIAKIYALPQNKTNIFVTGRTETVNAFTWNEPVEIMMFTTPVTQPDFTFREDWQKTFFTHELIHAANMNFEDKKNPLIYMFGQIGSGIDLSMVNGWALEGLTTVLETELTNGGRGRSPIFELDYKAPTLENSFISYNEIGMEKEPPYGQSYVMGYLIMRSIADRFGIETLADIERNRTLCGSWEDSVLKVTGISASEIYKDVKKALVKKYADERKIPEGITISPRNTGTFYYNPAVVLDDGSYITIRSAKGQANAVVKYNPAGKRGSKSIYATDEEDSESINRETVLFYGSFPGSDSITADASGKVYAIMGIQHNDSQPGLTLETNLYSWDKDNGTKQLTRNYSLFQPSVSRDGSTLIAVRQKGMKMTLVKVDTSSGQVTELLSDPKYSFIQPAVNKDGTKVAFLAVDDTRARVAYMNLSEEGKFKFVGNNDQQIYDPAYPFWQADDSLTYSCNYRGRLEIFEVLGDGPVPYDYDKAENFSEKAVIADPVAALWAYKTEKGIYYASYAATGNVIKMFPAEKWGEVPENEGPSPAGEVICFGHLENDLPDFTPFEPLAKKEEIKKRTEENKKKAEEAASTITTLQNEKRYGGAFTPLLYLPIVSVFDDKINDKSPFGAGFLLTAFTSRKQMNPGIFFMDAIYYFSMQNISGEGGIELPIGPAVLDIIAYRILSEPEAAGNYLFTENNNISVGYTLPLIYTADISTQNQLVLIGSLSGSLIRTAKNPNEVCSITSPMNNNLFAEGQIGIEYCNKSRNPGSGSGHEIKTALFGTTYFDAKTGKFFFGGEGDFDWRNANNAMDYGFSLAARYTNYPADFTPTYSLVKLKGKHVDSSYSTIAVPQAYLTFNDFFGEDFDIKLYTETALKYNPGDIQFDIFDNLGMVTLGIEGILDFGRSYIACGYSFETDFSEKFISHDIYISCRMNWFRF